jgi:transketolase
MTKNAEKPEIFDVKKFHDTFPTYRTQQTRTGMGQYYNLVGSTRLSPLVGIDEEKIAELGKILCGLIMTMVDVAKSGHPGGSLSKVIQLITLLCSGAFRFDFEHPKNPGRDRLVASAGHCSPLFHALNALVRETLRYEGIKLSETEEKYYLDFLKLLKFRTLGGPSGHVESHYALEDASTGSSGHGLSTGLGFATLHKSNGLPTKVFVVMGDAETEEGMVYEARNVALASGISNLVVLLDYNKYGIDGPITEAMPPSFIDDWRKWNVIEVDGHNIRELAYAYKIAELPSDKPTVIISHTTKGKFYGKLEDTSDSHGTPLPHDDYVKAMENLGFTDNNGLGYIGEIKDTMDYAYEGINYFFNRLNVAKEKILPEKQLRALMYAGKPMVDHTSIKRPLVLPPELVFTEGVPKATRFATEAFFTWLMKKTGFFYVGTGDLSKSILTRKAEEVYGIITPENSDGHGIRFGIAEQNMAMMSVAMSQDVLPGGYKSFNVFATYGVFTVMMANSVRMGLINNAMNPEAKSCFCILAAHDGPETGEDGPTHHGLFWMSLFMAYPGIKVYKPLDANETIEMLFYAIQRNEPFVMSVARPNTPVFEREGTTGVPPAIATLKGAYIFQSYKNNGKPKLPVAISGGGLMGNFLQALPKIEEVYDVKIIAVSSPESFDEFRKINPKEASKVLSDKERKTVVALHNGWPGFLYPVIMTDDQKDRVHGIERFLASGRPEEIYLQAGFDPAGIAKIILEQ